MLEQDAMSGGLPEASLMEHQPKRLRLLYEPLCLLRILSEVRGDRIKPGDIFPEGPGLSATKSYRSFVDAIAYICAYRKRPGYVTAAALEQTPDAIVILLAANDGIDTAVVTLLEKVLIILSWIIENPTVRLDTKEGREVMKILTVHVLGLNAPKIFEYYQQVNKLVSLVMGRLNAEPKLKGTQPCLLRERLLLDIKADKALPPRVDQDSIINLRKWISTHLSKEGLQLQEKDMQNLALSSYRDREVFKALHHTTGSLEHSHNFEQLHNLLYKLGKHVAQCKRLIEATIRLRLELSRGLRIETIGRSRENQIPLLARTCDIDNISHRIFSDPVKQDIFLQQVQQIYSKKELDRLLSKDVCKGKTRVHAELLVLDHFEQTGGRFLNEKNKYIGCSKPACYLCHMFISCHPRGYASPPSHQKLYLNWRLPDVRTHEQNAAMRFQHQQNVLLRMIDTVRGGLINDIATSVGKQTGFADSTAGGTSTIVDIETDLGPGVANLSLEELRVMLDRQGGAGRSVRENHMDPKFRPRGFPFYPIEVSVEAESDDSATGGVDI
ncbi:hypothetical protein DTO013E5_9983 [Penicillium roqueforti]|nr:hypothetical protein DTO012A1_9982 [Penicillium roqueforti]KAI2737995.1 hypothetical protein DTO013F2_9702 [Penicillium roqueforti]KAI2765582.1 hypothetical protein DTO012A8_9199 [Penicillium roqueforti]KAI3062930.1 hypothetical protein CBS147339_9789 [Penicillium roqueforti]KAI3091901.1 hypothetical protein CBS147338_8120 [Penicillium roqueforti]